jgi:hypothetical protein
MLGHDGDDLALVFLVGRRLLEFVIERGASATELAGKGGGREAVPAEPFTGRSDFFPPASFRERRCR